MKLYKTTITPTSNFITPIKGDTLFGQICWAIKFSFGEDRLKELLKSYDETPFLVVSDAFVAGYLPKPTMPSIYLKEDLTNKKENRKKIWLTLEQLKNGEFNKALEFKNIVSSEIVVKTSINYKTAATGNGFDPHSQKELSISNQDLYFLINSDFDLNDLKKSLKLVNNIGFGKKSTTGKGRFEFDKFEEITIEDNSSTYMALSPFSLDDFTCKDVFYEPFTRFGKTGASRANTNAFKKPILLADSGTVVVFEEKKKLNYIGKAIKNISTYKDIVHQGYSIVVPIKDI